ncbi:tripartite tricarboxylate transporter permease [Ancylobacter sonchi]|uniref:tripartite tricarboxylate transporter permease n=1 Tax=Ancylobacter sonchi TaxID=1937790 RepID=UPI001BD3105D|nr:tripartite tricarboxylate transporter permease [Ancylobacter sonchi]MBS7534690.1 tripartite tricarboxylate transporter permease [Ancylobacter sonchi]
MDGADLFLHGLTVALQPHNLGYIVVGCLLGTVVGILPGLGPSAGMALLIPIVFGMDPTSALMMIAAIYYGAMYGGSATSILLNTPGEASSVMTTLDGYQMARNGRAGAALAVSAIGSFIAGTVGIVLLSALSRPLAQFALQFGPPEYFTLMVFSMLSAASLGGRTVARGLLSMLIGLVIATIGIDLQSGMPRFTGGFPQLLDGVDFILAAVGLFALSEVFVSLEDHFRNPAQLIGIKGRLWLTREEWRRSVGPIIRGTAIGFVKGVLPGGGATVSTMLSYSLERALSKDKAKFGTGMIEGVAGPEAANNSSAAGSMVPLLALGLPGSGATAVLLGAFVILGIQPGPLLINQHPEVFWGLVNSMYVGNVVLFVMNLPLIFLFVQLLRIPTGILFPLVIAIASIGVYAVNGSVFDLYIVFGFGLLGYAFRKLDVPTAPLVLALVLGGMMEQSFRQSMTISGGDLSIFVSSGLAILFLVLSVLALGAALVVPSLLKARGGRVFVEEAADV